MNMFKTLDSYFPCGAARLSGEVVSVSITLRGINEPSRFSGRDAVISMKRKAWYVNASVNAFHMHRELVKELTIVMDYHGLSSTLRRTLRHQVAVAVAYAYCENRKHDRQYHDFEIIVENGEALTMWYSFETNTAFTEWSELCIVDTGMSTKEDIQITIAASLEGVRKNEVFWELIPYSFLLG